MGERTEGSEQYVVRSVSVELNVHGGARGRRYAIAPSRLLAVQKEARRRGLEVVGYYHSHPDAPPVPSATDLEAAWPATSYLILSVAASGVREVRSWRLAADTGELEEEEVEYRSA